MIILTKLSNCQKFIGRLAGRPIYAALGFTLVCGVVSPAHAWITLDLPDLVSTPDHGGAIALAHLSDGQLIYANNGAIYEQDSFGSPSLTPYAAPPDVDPGFITVLGDTTALVGAGFSSQSVYQFNPSSTSAPGFVEAASLNNYAAAPASSTSAYIDGGTFTGPSSISYVSLTGSLPTTPQLLVSSAGTFSAGLASDKAGNLYVGDYDNNGLYEFSAATLQSAVQGSSTLTLADALLLHTFDDNVTGSLAVDATGRVWAAGFGADGLFWFDPANDTSGVMNPQAPGGFYTLGTFSAAGNDYVSYVWQAGFSPGDQVVYGYANALDVPEPAASAFFAALVAGTWVWWKRGRCVSPA